MAEDKNYAFKMPDRLITTVDLARITRELKLLDDWLNQAAIRAGGQEVKAPKTSATLDEIAASNGVSLLDASNRKQLIVVLETFAKSAPKIHMSFPVEPSPNFLAKMIVWLRANINPVILMDVGLQPALAAGCSVRTSNKYFDMSLRNRFVDSRSYLVNAIEEFSKNTATSEEPATSAQPVVADTNPVATEVTETVPAQPIAATNEQPSAPAVQPTQEAKA